MFFFSPIYCIAIEVFICFFLFSPFSDPSWKWRKRRHGEGNPGCRTFKSLWEKAKERREWFCCKIVEAVSSTLMFEIFLSLFYAFFIYNSKTLTLFTQNPMRFFPLVVSLTKQLDLCKNIQNNITGHVNTYLAEIQVTL